jgi:hypothetical protein
MKKFLTIVALLLLVINANSQVVRVGLLGVGIGGGSKGGGATLHIVDISYAPQPRFDVGIYSNLGLGGSSDADGENASFRGGFGIGAQGKFYITTGKIKPFVGLQAGPRFGGSVSVSDDLLEEAKGGVSMQVIPQVGLRLGPVNIWGSYINKSIQGNFGFVFGFGNFDN